MPPSHPTSLPPTWDQGDQRRMVPQTALMTERTTSYLNHANICYLHMTIPYFTDTYFILYTQVSHVYIHYQSFFKHSPAQQQILKPHTGIFPKFSIFTDTTINKDVYLFKNISLKWIFTIYTVSGKCKKTSIQYNNIHYNKHIIPPLLHTHIYCIFVLPHH